MSMLSAPAAAAPAGPATPPRPWRWIPTLYFGQGLPYVVVMTLAVFWLMAFASATHDIAADGFYMLALPQRTQAAFVGVRSTFYRLAMIGGQGGLVYLAGWLQDSTGDVVTAWQMVFWALAVVFTAGAALHFWTLPRPARDVPVPRGQHFWADFLKVFAAFFAKPEIGRILAFLLLYRFAEAQLLKLVTPFMLDPVAVGGLGLKTQDVGIAYGTFGIAALTVGGLLGGWVISRFGLKRVLWPLVLCMHVPNTVYVALAVWQPGSLWLVSAAIATEQFGYGFGFTAYMVFMLMVAGGADGSAVHKTAHYALCTGFMALGMMIPGMWSGWLQDQLGYVNFFIWACVATLPSFLAAAWIRIDPEFGRKET